MAWANAMTSKLTSKEKEIHDNLSAVNGMRSWTMTIEEDKLAGVGVQAIDRASESSFGSLADAVGNFKMTIFTNAGIFPW